VGYFIGFRITNPGVIDLLPECGEQATLEQNLHVTILALGKQLTDVERFKAEQSTKVIAGLTPVFEIQIQRVDWFAQSITWLSAESERIYQIAKHVITMNGKSQKLLNSFVPHITMGKGRVLEHLEHKDLGLEENINRICLFHSEGGDIQEVTCGDLKAKRQKQIF
jgi:2'-5' RNA ligase